MRLYYSISNLYYVGTTGSLLIMSKNFPLINLSLNFSDATIYHNKLLLENLVAVH